jgi:hypothetical protein
MSWENKIETQEQEQRTYENNAEARRVMTVDEDGNYVSGGGETSPTDGYGINNIDNSGPNYYGFENQDGNWYIIKEVDSSNPSAYTYAAGTSDYATAWTNRTTQTYDTFGNTF